jgi:FkbM family methyltransferase
MLEALRTTRAVLRSLRIYYGDRARARAMDELYARFVKPGDLVFDIGAHVGDRVAAFRRLGARVVAAEPQPAFARLLRLMYGRDGTVLIRQAAVGRTVGETDLLINVDNPTVSTASHAFVQSARGARGWARERWSKSIRVPLTTLDALIGEFGVPSFIKLDVEGFEFATIQRPVALACIERCVALGFTRFNAALGESQTFAHADWTDGAGVARWLSELPDEANSGDIYAVRA